MRIVLSRVSSLAHRLSLGLGVVCLALVADSRPLGAQDEPVRTTEQGILVDFQDADISVVIAALAEAGGLNVIYADLPPRRITLRLRQPVPRANIAALLRSVAQANGLVVTEEAAFIRLESTQPGAGTGIAGGAAAADSAVEDVRLFIYQLRHARAPRLAATLQALFGGSTAVPRAPGISRRPLSERLREQAIPPAGEPEPRVEVQVGPVAAPSISAQLRGSVQIVPDEMTNSLIVRAERADWEIVQQAIETLDLRPLQVLIEVTIAEVRHTRDLDVGVSGTVDDARSNRNGETGVELEGSSAGDFLFKVMRGGDIDVTVALSALATRGDVRIISRPIILAQNNQEARILVGSERPFVQVSRSLPTDDAVRDQVVQYRDVGTSLTILPTINPDGYVNMQVIQEVSNATSELQFGAPVISTREASTHLFLKDGQTAVIGGLVDRQRDRSRGGIPILSSIPGIGVLFGSTRRTTTDSELFLFLTPRIVATDADAEQLRDDVESGARLLREALPEATRPMIPVRPASPTPSESSPQGAP